MWGRTLGRVLAAVALFVAACTSSTASPERSGSEQLYRQTHAAMGTLFNISCYAASGEIADAVLGSAFGEIDRLDDLLSNYKPTSELSRISREAAGTAVATDPETFRFLERSLFWSKQSAGAFDITVGPLLRAWGFKARSGHLPSTDEQRSLRQQVGWEKVHLNEADRTVRFSGGHGIELDPGSIGKGFAVDAVVAVLRAQGVRRALISAGGSTVYALGTPPDAEGWPVEVPDPRTPGTVAWTIPLRDTSLSTGACTEKFLVLNGHKYCHIFDPRTLQPVEGVLQSTVIAPSATDSDALSTVTFVLPASQSAPILRETPDTRAVVFYNAAGTPSCVAFGAPQSACDTHTPQLHQKGTPP